MKGKFLINDDNSCEELKYLHSITKHMKITVYDGTRTIGGNKIYVEDHGQGIFLDFGFNFAKYGEFYQEYLTERTIRGIYDLITLGLIPKLNIYREDLIPEDLSVSSYPKLNVKGVFVTHAHLDHFGNVGLLHENVPIASSNTTLSFMKALRDISSGFGVEAMYNISRKRGSDKRILTSKGVYVGRKIVLLEKIGDDLLDFLEYKPGGSIEHRGFVNLEDLNLKFDVEGYEVDHSIYGAYAYKINGNSVVTYTGDMRFHGENGEKTEEFVKKARDSTALIIEGTRVGRKEGTIPEKDVEDNALKVVENSKSLVIVDFSPRNFERLEIFRRIAEKTSREMVVTSKDAYMLHAMSLVDGKDRMKDMKIYKELRAKRDKWESEVIMAKWGDRYVDPKEISQNPERYILCFSFYDIKNLLDMKIRGGTYIYSSSEAFGEEQFFDFIRLKNWLRFFGFRTFGFDVDYSGDTPMPVFTGEFHSSGHMSEEEIIRVIDMVDPDYIIPVHTEHPEWFRKNFDNAILLNDGEGFEV